MSNSVGRMALFQIQNVDECLEVSHMRLGQFNCAQQILLRILEKNTVQGKTSRLVNTSEVFHSTHLILLEVLTGKTIILNLHHFSCVFITLGIPVYA